MTACLFLSIRDYNKDGQTTAQGGHIQPDLLFNLVYQTKIHFNDNPNYCVSLFQVSTCAWCNIYTLTSVKVPEVILQSCVFFFFSLFSLSSCIISTETLKRHQNIKKKNRIKKNVFPKIEVKKFNFLLCNLCVPVTMWCAPLTIWCIADTNQKIRVFPKTPVKKETFFFLKIGVRNFFSG